MLDKYEFIRCHVINLVGIIANSSNQRDNRVIRFRGYQV